MKPHRRPDLEGFVQVADAVVPCKLCGAAEGVPCIGEGIRRGFVHFGRRLARLMLTAKATAAERAGFEASAVWELHKYLSAPVNRSRALPRTRDPRQIAPRG